MRAKSNEPNEPERGEGRRGFLKLAGVGTLSGATAAIVGAGHAEASELTPGPNSAGYRETAHVKKVYDLSKF